MGGCYDDRVVGIAVDEFLEMEYAVGTFNFRGAPGSKGRTSWTGKPELDDYISFAVFFVYYLHGLSPPSISASEMTSTTVQAIQIILGGYSYGSLIVKHLPSLSTILSQFRDATQSLPGSSHSEILLRAGKLASQRITELEEAKTQSRRQQARHALSVTMGGEETSPAQRRRSSEHHNGRRSLDVLRSLKHPHLQPKGKRKNSETLEAHVDGNANGSTDTNTFAQPLSTLTMPVPNHAYLLISPLLPPISTLTVPALGYKFWNRSGSHTESFTLQPTLAVFGDRDPFTSVKRTRAWAERLGSGTSGKFRAEEVRGAGHFWLEPGVEEELRGALKRWGSEVWGTD
jgi:hypothetical protein